MVGVLYRIRLITVPSLPKYYFFAFNCTWIAWFHPQSMSLLFSLNTLKWSVNVIGSAYRKRHYLFEMGGNDLVGSEAAASYACCLAPNVQKDQRWEE